MSIEKEGGTQTFAPPWKSSARALGIAMSRGSNAMLPTATMPPAGFALIAIMIAAILGLLPFAARAQTATQQSQSPEQTGQTLQIAQTAPSPAPVAATDPLSDYVRNWFARVDATQAEQPHWMTPIATTTPRLEEEFRFDTDLERLGNGGSLDNFGGGKGLELIPAERVEIIVGLPPYIAKTVPGSAPINGFNDWPFLLIKYRLLSANEQNGNYILTVFLQGQAPTGIAALTDYPTWFVTPTIAGGIGFGDFDIQSTLGEAIATVPSAGTGNMLVSNTTLQYHLWDILWPEFEVNVTNWQGGGRAGKTQVFLTPGLVVGRVQLVDRVKLSVGVGYQFAVAPESQTRSGPLTPQYRNNFIVSTRFSF
jgi:hypothetical protein